ncbi:hypothetical protein ETI06_07735 [Macrococcoides goetzii]|nr:hypothetical protein [Macrococcus goetzii]TDM49424.1 hypothetical protein ETI06_07735 [Macrococcus goetzii]
MNEEEKVSKLIDERTELIPHEIIFDKESIQLLDETAQDNEAIMQERMTTDEILREFAEEDELEEDHKNALDEVKLYKYIINTINFHEGDAISVQQLHNIAAHSHSKLTQETLNTLLDDYIEAGYIRIQDECVYVTFLGQHAMTLLQNNE